MTGTEQAESPVGVTNTGGTSIILALATLATILYVWLALAGDLRQRPALLLPAVGAQVVVMLGAWRVLARRPGTRAWAIGAALVFRLAAAPGEPSLSDDLYRYLWDGRVQLEGVHPYRFAPDDPALANLRDDVWTRINHREVKTIYPPVAQATFVVAAAAGAGPVGWKLLMGLADFGAVLVLAGLLRRLGLPDDRIVLYGWNPLAVLETAGSGHVEPVGVILLLGAIVWAVEGRPVRGALALAASVHVKLLPVLLVPAFVRRAGAAAALPLLVGLVLPFVPYAATGPAVAAGMADYAERWERNAFVYPLVEGAMDRIGMEPAVRRALGSLRERLGPADLPWSFLYRHVWPRDIARLVVVLAALAWAVLRGVEGRASLVRASLWIVGGALLLSPTLHPWYLLWVLPLAAATRSWGWLLLCATVTVSYAVPGEVPWTLKCVEYVPPLALALALSARRPPARIPV